MRTIHVVADAVALVLGASSLVACRPGELAGAAESAREFKRPHGVAIDAAGTTYVADTGNHVIRRIAPDGAMSTLAGLPGSPGSADGTGPAARFSHPHGVAVDAVGNVYVADTHNHVIREITPAGVVSTLAGRAGAAGSGDGAGPAARFWYPSAVAVDAGGNVYVADTANNTVRSISAAGVVSTVAGVAGPPGSVDGTGPGARFRSPVGVAVDRSGNVYVADWGNHVIRRITAGHVVTTLAGLAHVPGHTDGTGSSARFAHPGGVWVDGSGDVYVADTHNRAIRRITPPGVVSTVDGGRETSGGADATRSATRLDRPTAVAGDGVTLLVADGGAGSIRRIGERTPQTWSPGQVRP